MAPFFPMMRALLMLFLLEGVLARSEMCVILSSSERYTQLNENQKKCAADTISSVGWMSTCKDKACFCASPQFMSDETDKCMVALGSSNKGMYSTDTYNGIMAFFGNECGTFEVQFKQVASESITYTTSFTQVASTKTGGQFPTVQPASVTQEPGTATTGVSSPPPSSSDNENDGENSGGGLSVEAIVGIVAGVATVIGTMIAAYMCWRRRR